MSDEDLSDLPLSDWGKNSRPASRNSTRSEPPPSSLRRSRSQSRGDLRPLSPQVVVEQSLPPDLHDKLDDLLGDDKTRDQLVDTMVAMTQSAQTKPVPIVKPYPAKGFPFPNDPGYLIRAGSPVRTAPSYPVRTYDTDRDDRLRNWDFHNPFGGESMPRGYDTWHTPKPNNLRVDLDSLNLGNMAPRDQTLMKAFAKLMVEDLVPKLKDELSSEVTHNSMIMRERRAGMINAPVNFPPTPVLMDMDRSTQARYLTYWGTSVFKKKFSGDPKKVKWDPEIAYWLTRHCGSQYFFPLSEPEFRDQLLNNTEGSAWTKVSGWMSQQLPLQEIFNKLLACYDKREKSHEAIMKLEALKFSDFSNWADAETEIERLAMRGSLARTSVTGHGQRALFHYLATKHLVAILPEPLKLEAERRINTYCNSTGQELKFHTLVELMEKDRDAIDRLLAERSGARRKKHNGGEVQAITYIEKRKPDTKPVAVGQDGKNGVRQIANPQLADDSVNVIGHQRQAGNGRGYETKPRESLCRKCKVPGHEEVRCPHYEDQPSKYTCNYCHMDAYHNKEKCLFKIKGIQNRNQKGPDGSRAGARSSGSKN